jgi:single-strand DNA-binding protein
MSGSVNKVILVGNLGRDPEVRRTNNGDPVVSFSIATTESWRDKATGERKDRTEWHNIVIFNENLCKVAEQYCKKGAKIYIEGALQTREFTDKEGHQRKSTEVVLTKFRGDLQLLESRSRGEEGAYAGGGESFGRSSPMQRGGGAQSGGNFGGGAASGGGQSGGFGGGRASDSLDDDIPF